jgi:hypothetical protein
VDGHEIRPRLFLFLTALTLLQKRYWELFSGGLSGRTVQMTAQLHTVPRLRMVGPYLHSPMWLLGNIYLYFSPSLCGFIAIAMFMVRNLFSHMFHFSSCDIHRPTGDLEQALPFISLS